MDKQHKPIGADWKKWYDALKHKNFHAFNRAISYAESVSLSFDTPLKAAAEYERASVARYIENYQLPAYERKADAQ